jgi:hypothetical protein
VTRARGLPSATRAAAEKYLARYAEPEARQLPAFLASYEAGLVVPALAESVALLEGYRVAAQAAQGRVLVVLVVNAAADTDPALAAQNQELLASLAARAESACEGGWLLREPEFDVWVIDRTSHGRRLPPKQGVGLARKIGADALLALGFAGRLAVPCVFFTDADVALPSDYFARGSALLGSEPGAILYPFTHVDAAGDAALHDATLLYELTLRYHVLGLAAAGSPYAFHSVGSTIAVPFAGYVTVRGVPKLLAGEDFYLLDKLGKVAPLVRLGGEPIAIHARSSRRVPFGTGPRVERFLAEQRAEVMHPRSYEVLSRVLAVIDRFARERDEAVFRGLFSEFGAAISATSEAALEASGLGAAACAARTHVGAADLARRIHSWFDGLRSLRFLHALRPALPDMPCLSATESAAFTALEPGLSLSARVCRLREAERALPATCGPSCPRQPRPAR